ncbi:MAG: hypothetical protein HQL14_05100 [Candidatus Omnitrophica bacterium]|nr:hypothetical protein [Candidatus Omnitrophota bacterium]
MNYEKLKTHLWILENGKQWYWEDFAKALNTKIIEIDPNRLSRPLSNLIEVFDAKFRANLWDLIPPHPTLSLQWPFLFIGLPILLYKFFRNLNCQPIIALAGMSLYLTSSGFLSPIIMLSHPAKNMVNFFSILSLFLISQFYRVIKTSDVSIKNVPYFWWTLISCFLGTMITFLSDETGLFLFLILAIVSYPLFLKLKEKILPLCCFFILPVLYLVIIRFLLPWLHLIVNHKIVHINDYRDYPHLSSLFFPNWHDVLTNAYLLFSAHPNLKWNFSPLSGHPFLIFLQCLYSLAFLLLVGSFVYCAYRRMAFTPRIKQILSGLSILIIFIFFHTFQLSHNVRVWTVFYYGCLFSLIYYGTLTLVLQFLWEEFKGNMMKGLLPFIIIIFTAHALMTTTYIIRIFKNQGLDPKDYSHPLIFSGQINPYQYFNLSQSIQKSRCRYIYTLWLWSQIKHKKLDPKSFASEIQFCSSVSNQDPFFQIDLLYFTIEGSFEFPSGRSFLNDPGYVAAMVHQVGEPP